MIYKAFSFPSAPEVGRIIDTSQRASTVNFKIAEIDRFVITYIEESVCEELFYNSQGAFKVNFGDFEING